eukprot:Sdes_comp20917_c0_seq1m18271
MMMRWESNIHEAVQKVREARSTLVVYVEGNDEKSQLMTSTIFTDPDVGHTFQKLTALKLKQGSEDWKKFCQVYPVPILPSVYFISFSGRIVNMIAGFASKETLLERVELAIDSVLKEQGKIAFHPGEPQEVPSSKEKKISTAEKPGEVSKSVKDQPAKGKESKRINDKPDTNKPMKSLKGELRETSSAHKSDLEPALRKAKSSEEVSCNLKSKTTVNQEGKKDFVKGNLKAPPIETSNDGPTSETSCTILIRFPDGSVLRKSFQCLDRLLDVKKFCELNRPDIESFQKDPHLRSQFLMRTNFPARTFLDQDMNKTLSELGFYPNGTILISQIHSPNSSSAAPLAFLSSIFSLSSWICDKIAGFLSKSMRWISYRLFSPSNSSNSFHSNPIQTPSAADQKPLQASSSRNDAQAALRKRYSDLATFRTQQDEAAKKMSFNGNNVLHSHDEL